MQSPVSADLSFRKSVDRRSDLASGEVTAGPLLEGDTVLGSRPVYRAGRPTNCSPTSR